MQKHSEKHGEDCVEDVMPKHQHRTLTRNPGRKTSFPFQVFIMEIVYLDKNKEKEKL